MFTLSRNGEFYALPKGCNHCGVDDKQHRFKYEYFIRALEDALDEKGFIVDNLAPQQWFDSIVEFDDSCELLARKAAKAFASFCKSPHTVIVRIQPFNGAWVEYEFKCVPEKGE